MTALMIVGIAADVGAIGYFAYRLISRRREQERERAMRALSGEAPDQDTPSSVLRELEDRAHRLHLQAQALDSRVRQTLSETRDLHAEILGMRATEGAAIRKRRGAR